MLTFTNDLSIIFVSFTVKETAQEFPYLQNLKTIILLCIIILLVKSINDFTTQSENDRGILTISVKGRKVYGSYSTKAKSNFHG